MGVFFFCRGRSVGKLLGGTPTLSDGERCSPLSKTCGGAASVFILLPSHARPTLPRKQTSKGYYAVAASIQPKRYLPGEKYTRF